MREELRLVRRCGGVTKQQLQQVLKNEPGPPSCGIGGTVEAARGVALGELICWL